MFGVMRVVNLAHGDFAVLAAYLALAVITGLQIPVLWSALIVAPLFGVIGYWLRKLKYPLAPLVVALVLGDSTERELRKALISGGGSPLFFVSSWLSTATLLLAFVLVLIPLVRTLLARRRGATVAAAAAGDAAR